MKEGRGGGRVMGDIAWLMQGFLVLPVRMYAEEEEGGGTSVG